MHALNSDIHLKVQNTSQAVSELENELGFSLRNFMEGTVKVPPRLEIDMKKLKSYLNWALKLHDKGI